MPEYYHRPTMDDQMGAVPWWALVICAVAMVVAWPFYKLSERKKHE